MDPNKRGNPPYEPSSHAAGMQRTIARNRAWMEAACVHARMMIEGDALDKATGECWWRQHFNMPQVVLSVEQVRASLSPVETTPEEPSVTPLEKE